MPFTQACTVSYTSFDAAVFWGRYFGQGALMAKSEIESAFRLLPAHPDMTALGCHWNGEFYVYRCLPMSCSITCPLFEQFSSFVEWVVRNMAGVESIVHYLDDFLCVAPASSRICVVLLNTLEHIADRFPLAPDRTEGPSTSLTSWALCWTPAPWNDACWRTSRLTATQKFGVCWVCARCNFGHCSRC